MVLTTGSHLRKPTSPARSLKPRLPVALTGAGGHAAGTKGVPALGVGHGLKGVRVVGDQGWAVQLTDAAVVEVEAGLGDRQLVVTGLLPPDVRGARGQCQARCPCPSPPRGGGPSAHIPGSQSAWGPCSRQHTARGSSRWAASPCSGRSRWHTEFESLSGKGRDEGWVATWAPDPRQHHLLGKSPCPHQGTHLGSRHSPLPSPLFHPALPPGARASLKLTGLAVLGAFSPAVGRVTGWGTGFAWVEKRGQ